MYPLTEGFLLLYYVRCNPYTSTSIALSPYHVCIHITPYKNLDLLVHRSEIVSCLWREMSKVAERCLVASLTESDTTLTTSISLGLLRHQSGVQVILDLIRPRPAMSDLGKYVSRRSKSQHELSEMGTRTDSSD